MRGRRGVCSTLGAPLCPTAGRLVRPPGVERVGQGVHGEQARVGWGQARTAVCMKQGRKVGPVVLGAAASERG